MPTLASLIENPGDVDARLVYADILQGQGDPRGELITLHHRGTPEAIAAYLEKHADTLLGPLARFQRTWSYRRTDAFTWHLGFIRRAVVAYDSNGDRPADVKDVEADDAVAAILTHPSGALLEELVVQMNMLDDGMYFDPVLQAIATHGAPALRSLGLGEFRQAGPGSSDGNDYDYENSWAGFGDGKALWAKLPRLERLRIQLNLGGASLQDIPDEVGVFDLPNLQHLEVITGGMRGVNVRAFASGDLPRLETMELWTGNNNYGSDGNVDDLAALLAGERVPRLTRLGIMNCEFVEDVVGALVKSPLLPRLRQLSLAHGMMTDAGAQALATHADAFAHLDVLDLTGNYIQDVEPVRRICKSVLVEQRDWDDDYRYVALGE